MLPVSAQPSVSNPPSNIISSAQDSSAAQKQPTATWSGLANAMGVGAVLGGAFHLVAPEFPGKSVASFAIALAPAGLYCVSHYPEEEEAVNPFPHITDQFEPFAIKQGTPAFVRYATLVAKMTQGISISTVSAWAQDEGRIPPTMSTLYDAFTSTKGIMAGAKDSHGLVGIAFMVDKGWATRDLPGGYKPDTLQHKQKSVSVSRAGDVDTLPLAHLAPSDVLFCYRKVFTAGSATSRSTSPIIGIRRKDLDTYVLFDPKQGAYTCSDSQCKDLFNVKNEADHRTPSHFIGFTKQD